MYESPIITAEIKSQKGFFVGDPCYALTRSMYENLWGKQHGYKDGVFIYAAVKPSALAVGI